MAVPARSRSEGVTLIELMVTLSVIAILLTLTVTGFQSLTAHNRITAAANGLIAHLQLARSEAVKRAPPVTICPSNDGASCLNSPAVRVARRAILSPTLDGAKNVVEVLRRVDDDEMTRLSDSDRARSAGSSSTAMAPPLPSAQSDCAIQTTRRESVWCASTSVGRSYVMCSDPNAYSCPETCP